MTKELLDPIAKQILEERLAEKLPPLSEWTIEFARSLQVPCIHKHRISLSTQSGKISMNVHTPPGDGPFPLVLFFHGGGFAIDIDDYVPTLQQLAEFIPAIIVAPQYRLAPEHKFPAAIEDSISVFEALTSGLDIGKKYLPQIIVAGDSAGGNLAAGLVQYAVQNKINRIAGQLLVYPWLDLALSGKSYQEFSSGFGLSLEKIIWYRNHYLPHVQTPLTDPIISPLYQNDLDNYPSSFIATAACDVIRDDGERYAAKLQHARNEVILKRYDGMIHGFLEMGDRLHQARELILEIKNFVSTLPTDPS